MNLGALGIGFLLIIVVISIFMLKSRLSGDREGEVPVEKVQEPQKKYASISAEDLSKRNTKKKFTFIDLREVQYFDQEHILDSVNIPAESFNQEISHLEKQHEYILVDSVGLTPAIKGAMDLLEEADFEHYAYLEGGISGWKNKAFPLISAGDPYSFTDQSKVTYIKSDELKTALEKENNLFLVDLRTEGEYKSGHLPKAVNIELSQLEKKRSEIPFGRKIILYDAEGIKAFQGAVRLFDMGIFNVYALSDGLKTWQEKNFELVK